MKLIATLSVCLFVFSASNAQVAPAKKAAPAGKSSKTVFMGSIRDMRNKPIRGVEAFVYKPDSSIIASGYTDSTGHFETNSVPAGAYFVKLVYPSTKATTIYAITMKNTSMEINLKSNPPEVDTMFAYDLIMPKPAPAKAGGTSSGGKK